MSRKRPLSDHERLELETPSYQSINAIAGELLDYCHDSHDYGIVKIDATNFQDAAEIFYGSRPADDIETVELNVSMPYTSYLGIIYKDKHFTTFRLEEAIPEAPPQAVKYNSRTGTVGSMTVDDMAVMLMTITNHRAAQAEMGDL